ncbi:MAG: hypothetical protein KGL93_01365 [Gemmatimonadota bacterium]|nr:hypothetical protein [Gemmatimonadota bacterium]
MAEARDQRADAHAVAAAADADAALATQALALPFAGVRIGEVLPAAAWTALAPAAADPLSAGIRRRFDPRGVLNPGIFGAAA